MTTPEQVAQINAQMADWPDDPEPSIPTPREKLADIKVRVMSAQDAVGWAVHNGPEFDETIARSVVEYGRCLRDLAALVQALLPEDA